MATLICDMDGVVADLHSQWLVEYNRDWEDTLTVDSMTEWGLATIVKPECGSKVYKYLTGELYDRVAPVPGAVAAITALRDAGHTVVFASSCSRQTQDAKLEWLIRHRFLPSGLQSQPDWIVARRKDLLRGSLLLDDGIHNLQGWAQQGRQAWAFDQPWNRVWPGPRLTDWFSGLPELLGILDRVAVSV